MRDVENLEGARIEALTGIVFALAKAVEKSGAIKRDNFIGPLKELANFCEEQDAAPIASHVREFIKNYVPRKVFTDKPAKPSRGIIFRVIEGGLLSKKK